MAFPVASPGDPTGTPVVPPSVPPPYPAGQNGNRFAANGFIPEIWSGKLIEKFYSATVLSAISNTDYEGEIKNQGDRVKIRTKPTILIHDYKADGQLQIDRPEGGFVELYIDTGKYFNTILDDVMDIQSDLNALSLWSDDAAQQLKIQIDTDVLLDIKGQMHSRNAGISAGFITHAINLGASGTPVTVVPRSPITGQVEILDLILRLGQTLDEQNIPEEGRWLVMPVWAVAQLKFSDIRQAYLTGDSMTPLRNGRVGMIDRFTIYSSNLLPHGTAAGLASGEYLIYAGHAHGLTFASQISKVETLRSEFTFGTLLRGLQVYGSSVLDGKALAQAVVLKG